MVRMSRLLRYRFLNLFPSIVLAVFLFMIVNFIFLFWYTNDNRKSEHQQSWPPHIISILQRNFHLAQSEWRLISKSKYDEFNCSSLAQVRNKIYVNTGWTKVIHRTLIGDTAIAVKTVNLKGHDVSKCLEKGKDTLYSCYMKSSTKMLTEIVGLHTLQYPNIIKILGYCVPENPDLHNEQQISIITEFGEMIDTIKLLQMTWEERLKIALHIARLLHHLTETPLGSIALNDFRRQQFVFVEGILKLVDIDDLSTKSPPCDRKPCCITSALNKTLSCVTCEHKICKGYNEKQNIMNAGRHFIQHILPHDVPPHLLEIVNLICKAYETANWSALRILQETENLIDIYRKELLFNKKSQ